MQALKNEIMVALFARYGARLNVTDAGDVSVDGRELETLDAWASVVVEGATLSAGDVPDAIAMLLDADAHPSE